MKKMLAAAVCAVAWCSGAVANEAAAGDELALIREQLQSLTRRVERLEHENEALKSENTQLKAQAQAAGPGAGSNAADAGLISQMTAAGAAADAAGRVEPDQLPAKPVEAPKAADWPSRIALKGDLRLRQQQTDDARQAAQRDEQLLRVRASIEAKVSEQLVAGIGLSTSEGGNPRGANVRLDNQFSRKPLYVDLGYIDWTVVPGVHAIGGKMKMPFVRPGQSLFWDNDINPEGLAFTYGQGSAFSSIYAFSIDENVQLGATASTLQDSTDARMYGMQVGNRFALGASDLMLGVTYYDLTAARGRRPFFLGLSNGNSLDPSGGLAYDFQVFELLAEYNTRLLGRPMQLWLDAARNRTSERDTAIAAGALFGKLIDAGSWEVGLAYQLIEKDALFAQLIDSDFGGGFSDSRGWVLRTGFAPFKNWALNASYFMTSANVDVGDEYDFDRLLLDFNVKF